MVIGRASTDNLVVFLGLRAAPNVVHVATCIQDTLSSRAVLGLPLGRVRRASKGILHTMWRQVAKSGSKNQNLNEMI